VSCRSLSIPRPIDWGNTRRNVSARQGGGALPAFREVGQTFAAGGVRLFDRCLSKGLLRENTSRSACVRRERAVRLRIEESGAMGREILPLCPNRRGAGVR
jgi:hypothetical protein